MKKLLCNTLIIIILVGVFCNGYSQNISLSKSYRLFCYAETSTITDDDVVESFKAYCRDRNLIVDSSVLGAASSWTGYIIRNALNAIGVDMDTLQANISKEAGGNLGVRWLLTATGMNIYNRLFAELLQRESLSVGDDNVDKTVYSGKYLNGTLLWIINNTNLSSVGGSSTSETIIAYGGDYLHDGNYYISNFKSVNPNFDFTNGGYQSFSAYNGSLDVPDGSVFNYSLTISQQYKHNNEYPILYFGGNGYGNEGYFAKGIYANRILKGLGSTAIFYNQNNQGYYLGSYFTYTLNGVQETGYYVVKSFSLPEDGKPDDTDVTVKTPDDKKILPDPPENPTTIYPDGGGGGGDDPVNPDPDDPLDPYDPVKPFPDTPDNPTPDPGVHGSPGSDGTITIPDFNFDIPDINWSLDGLQHKFPFSLPFDLYNACKLLNAEPETPELDYTIDLVVYQWPVQMDLHWLDPAARVIRIFELLAFVVGLILITRHLIGG